MFLIGMVTPTSSGRADILVTYALCGSVLFFFDAVSPTRLIVLGIVLLLGSNLLFSTMGLSLGFTAGRPTSRVAGDRAGLRARRPG